MTRVTAATAVIILLIVGGCDDGREGGPLSAPSGYASYSSAPASVGQTIAFGLFLAKNSGPEAVIRSIEPAGPELAKGLDLRYAAVRPGSDCQVGALPGWPPSVCSGDLLGVDGFRVPKDAQAEVLVGARASTPGHWFVPSFRIRYDVDGTSFETVYPQGVNLTVSAG